MSQFQACWDCLYAYGGCSWSARWEPIEGWNARISTKKCIQQIGKYQDVPTYEILWCPQFEREPRTIKELKDKLKEKGLPVKDDD